MSRLVLLAAVAAGVGAALLLAETGRFARPRLAERLRPFHPGAGEAPRRPGGDPLREVLGPLVRAAGDRVAALSGVGEALDLRLRRTHSPLDATAFRLRQVAWCVAGLFGGVALAAAGLPAPVAAFCVVGSPVLAFLLVEQGLARRSDAWQRALARELPVVGEQLAMLLGAGWSLPAALGRLAERGRGCTAADLRTVVNRIRQGIAVGDALREWAEVAGIDPVRRLVAVLALEDRTGDLGALVSAEARQTRRDLQRATVELLERREQQVWVPVTVATLVPGVILLAVPFLAALRLFSSA